MSREPDSFSRRTLLRAAGLTPLAILGYGSDSGAQECNVWKQCTDKPVDTVKLEEIHDVLWGAFLDGASTITGYVGCEEAAHVKALQMSSPFVVCNFSGFSDAESYKTTKACCHACGKKAAQIAGSREINAADFELAWCKTKVAMANSRTRAAFLRENSGDDTPIPNRTGMGCV